LRSIIHIPITLFLVSFLIGQDDPPAESKSVQGAFGAVTTEGKNWPQGNLVPDLSVDGYCAKSALYRL
jgi:hypothetical protein